MFNSRRAFVFWVSIVFLLTLVVGLYFYNDGGPITSDESLGVTSPLTSTTSGVSASNYVLVPELGIRFVLPNNINDFYYVIKGRSIFFSRTSLKAISSLCDAEGAPFGLLKVTSKRDLSQDNTDIWYLTKDGLDSAVELGLAKDFGDQYLVYISPQDATCATVVSNPWGFDLRYLVSTAERIAN